jgi:hypothetical protein
VRKLFIGIFEQMTHIGFRAIIALTGHYGFKQFYTLKKVALEFMYKSNTIIAAMPEYEVAYEKEYFGDHAAKWETSILWTLRPELVNLSKLSSQRNNPLEGISGEDPRTSASPELGAEIVNHIVHKLAKLSGRMLDNKESLDRSKLIYALSLQLDILDTYWPNIRIIRKEYENFIVNLWNLNHERAIEIGRNLLQKNQQRSK